MSEDRVFPIISHLVNHEPLNGLLGCEIRSYLEIGVADGFTLSCRLRENLQLDELVLCDTWGATDGGTNRGSHEHIRQLLLSKGFPLERVTFLDGDSKLRIPEYFSQWPEKVFDLIFADGDHTGDGVWKDMINTIDHANILAVHDIRNESHLHLRDIFYAFYETVREDFIAIDDGYDLGMMIRRELFNWV